MRGGSLYSCLNAGYDIPDWKVGLGVGSEFQRVRAPQAKVLSLIRYLATPGWPGGLSTSNQARRKALAVLGDTLSVFLGCDNPKNESRSYGTPWVSASWGWPGGLRGVAS